MVTHVGRKLGELIVMYAIKLRVLFLSFSLSFSFFLFLSVSTILKPELETLPSTFAFRLSSIVFVATSYL